MIRRVLPGIACLVMIFPAVAGAAPRLTIHRARVAMSHYERQPLQTPTTCRHESRTRVACRVTVTEGILTVQWTDVATVYRASGWSHSWRIRVQTLSFEGQYTEAL